MKKIILFFILILTVSVFAQRPTNDWRVIYKNNCGDQKTENFEAGDVDEALVAFRASHPKEEIRIVGVCQISFVSCK